MIAVIISDISTIFSQTEHHLTAWQNPIWLKQMQIE